MASLRNTRSMEKYLAGWKSPVPSRQRRARRCSMRADTAVVWVRSRFFAASLVFQYDPYLHASHSTKLAIGAAVGQLSWLMCETRLTHSHILTNKSWRQRSAG